MAGGGSCHCPDRVDGPWHGPAVRISPFCSFFLRASPCVSVCLRASPFVSVCLHLYPFVTINDVCRRFLHSFAQQLRGFKWVPPMEARDACQQCIQCARLSDNANSASPCCSVFLHLSPFFSGRRKEKNGEEKRRKEKNGEPRRNKKQHPRGQHADTTSSNVTAGVNETTLTQYAVAMC